MNKQHVKETAIEMVLEAGLINLSRKELCERAGIPDGSFQNIMQCTFTEFVSELRKSNIHDKFVNHGVIRTRANPDLRKEQILLAAVDVAKEVGYDNMTREQIAEFVGVSEGLISRYFHTMLQLRRDVMRHAVRTGVASIIAQGLANKNKHAAKASPDMKKKAAALIANY